MMSSPSFVSIAVSRKAEARAAAIEAAEQIDQNATRFVLCFMPGEFDSGVVAATLNDALRGIPVFGCTSAGQITDRGYEDDSLMLLAFPKSHFRCASVMIDTAQETERGLDTTEIAAQVQSHDQMFRHTAGQHRLGLFFVDGLSKHEDILISTLEAALPDVPIFGGSAGDRMQFLDTSVLHHGAAHRDCAVLVLIETDLPFQGLSFDHFLPAQAKAIVTSAAPDERKVIEINGAPAAQEYARLVGCNVTQLSPQIFAENPMIIEYRGTHFVRAISHADDDGSLSFLGAIDDGLVMTLGRGREITETLKFSLDLRDGKGEKPDFILGFDCVLRRLEIEQKQLSGEVSDVLREARVFGFNTFGEQHQGVHMNQTLVGIAFFEPDARAVF